MFLGKRLRGRGQLNGEVAVGNDSNLEWAAGDLSRGCTDGRVHGDCEARVVGRCRRVLRGSSGIDYSGK